MTRNDLFKRTLLKLMVIHAIEDADPEDVQLLSDKYDSLHGLLTNEHLSDWSLSEDIPDVVELPIIDMLACVSASDFGLQPNYLEGAINLPRSKGGPSMAESQLRRQMAQAYVSRPARTEYF
jgi:hypothetical protein